MSNNIVTSMSLTPGEISTKRPTYRYEPLLEDDAIRVLHLYPNADETAELKCTVEHITLSQYKKDLINHYTALSYVWGLSTEKRHIIVDDCSFFITPNLDSALRHIRHDKGVMKVWADAICINQQDVEERIKQVQLMGSVYSIARHTIIYLSDSNEENITLFNTLHRLCDENQPPFSTERMYSGYSNVELQNLCKAIRIHIVDTTWFTRIWIFQELLLSSDPWIQCGKQRLKWGDVCQLSLLAKHRNPRPNSGKTQLADGEGLSNSSDETALESTISNIPIEADMLIGLEDMDRARHQFGVYVAGKGAGNTMLTCLETRRGLGVTDPRDMIYGHLGIASDALTGQLRIQVDYGRTCSELYADIAQYFIKRYGDYRILSYVEDVPLKKRRMDLPSWAPDWTSNALRYNTFKNNTMNSPVEFSFSFSRNNKRYLSSLGTIIGRVQYLGSPLHFVHNTLSEIREAWLRCLPRSLLLEEGGLDKELHFRAAEFPAEFPVMLQQFAQNMGFEDTDEFLAALPAPARRYQLKILQGLVNNIESGRPELGSGHNARDGGDKYPGLEEKTVENRQHLLIHPFALLSIYSLYFSTLRDGVEDLGVLEEKQRVMEGRRLCLYTDYNRELGEANYYIALVPQSTELGDLICALDGDSSYFAFREVKAGEGERGDDGSIFCNLVGTSYRGRMDLDEFAFKTRFVLQ